MTNDAYTANRIAFREKIAHLPSCEIKYHLLLLASALNKPYTPYLNAVLEAAMDVTAHCQAFLSTNEATTLQDALGQLQGSYHRLVTTAGTRSHQTRIIQGILHIGSVIAALILGILGGLIGGFAGLLRAASQFENPFRHAFIGFITGFAVGALIGFRAPKKFVKDEVFRQIKYTLDNLGCSVTYFAGPQYKALIHHRHAVQKRVLTEYFQNNQARLDAFLDGQHTYQIITLKARFISDVLRGYVGHHALIKLTLADQELALEFSLGASNLRAKAMQCEERQVSGEHVLMMMALHEQLQATHACTKRFIAERMKPGETDCLSYVNLLLTGTNQQPTCLTRYTAEDSIPGKLIGFFATRFSPFPATALQPEEAPQTRDHSDEAHI